MKEKDTKKGMTRRVSEEEKKFETETPKIEPLPGFIEIRYVKCGRSNCHCSTGKGHGPYHYWVYKTGGRKFKKYVKPEDLQTIVTRIEERKRQTKEAIEFNREAKLSLKILDARFRELKKLLELSL